MTKRDYEAIAAMIRETRKQAIAENPSPVFTLEALSHRLVSIMMEDNPRFQPARFLAACRGEDSTDSAGRRVRYSRSAS